MSTEAQFDLLEKHLSKIQLNASNGYALGFSMSTVSKGIGADKTDVHKLGRCLLAQRNELTRLRDGNLSGGNDD